MWISADAEYLSGEEIKLICLFVYFSFNPAKNYDSLFYKQIISGYLDQLFDDLSVFALSHSCKLQLRRG